MTFLYHTPPHFQFDSTLLPPFPALKAAWGVGLGTCRSESWPAAGEGTDEDTRASRPFSAGDSLAGGPANDAWQGLSPQMAWARPVSGFPLISSLPCAEEPRLALETNN